MNIYITFERTQALNKNTGETRDHIVYDLSSEHYAELLYIYGAVATRDRICQKVEYMLQHPSIRKHRASIYIPNARHKAFLEYLESVENEQETSDN